MDLSCRLPTHAMLNGNNPVEEILVGQDDFLHKTFVRKCLVTSKNSNRLVLAGRLSEFRETIVSGSIS